MPSGNWIDQSSGCQLVEWNDYAVRWVNEIPLLKTSGEEKYRFKSLVDVPDCFNEMFWFRICENCGKEFEAGPKCQRKICYECYCAKLIKKNSEKLKKLANTNQ